MSVRNLSSVTLVLLFCQGLFASALDLPEGRFAWSLDARIKRAEKIFAYPHDPDRVWVATDQGIMQTIDGGQNWALLPGTGREQLGRVSDVFFAPSDANVVFLGSRDKGVFRSMDLGKSWQNIGTEASGLKSLNVARIRGLPSDYVVRTLFCTHGGDVTGISKSMDAGQTWVKLSEDYICDELLFHETEIVMSGSRKGDDDIWAIHESTDGGQLWSDIERDVRTTAGATSKFNEKVHYFSVLKGRIVNADKLTAGGPEEGARWASLFYAFNDGGQSELLYAYDPYKFGLLASDDGFKTWRKENDQLFVGPLVKEGANVCAAANGMTLYASINGQLHVGRLRSEGGPLLANIKATPGVMAVPTEEMLKKAIERSAAQKEFGVTVTARIAPPEGAKIKNVHADLGALGLAPLALNDEGKNGDIAAGDGLYSGIFLPAAHSATRQTPKRPPTPGQTTLTVTATDDKGRSSAGTCVFSAFPPAQPWTFWDGDAARWGGAIPSCMTNSRMQELEKGAHSGARCLRIVGQGGAWSAAWGHDSKGQNASAADFLTFWIKVSAPIERDIKVFLTDGRGRERMANPSNEVWLFKDGYLSGASKDYRQVRIPMQKLVKKVGFFYDSVGGIGFGGVHEKGTEFYVDDVMFEPGK